MGHCALIATTYMCPPFSNIVIYHDPHRFAMQSDAQRQAQSYLQPPQGQVQPAQMWVEYDANAAPQVALSKDPEVVPPPVEPDGASQYQTPAGGAVVEVTKQTIVGNHVGNQWTRFCEFCRRRRVWLCIVTGIVLAIATAVSIAVVVEKQGAPGGTRAGADGDTQEQNPSNPHPSSPGRNKPVPSSTNTLSDPSVSPNSSPTDFGDSSRLTKLTSQATHPPQCDASSFEEKSWVGLNSFETEWETSTESASSAEDCCSLCYDRQDCAAWLASGNSSIWCTFIDANYKADGKDKRCTMGYPRVTFGGRGGGNYAGLGPCSEQNQP